MFIRGMRKQAVWHLCPYGEWIELCGSRVIFDRKYRPIARIWNDEVVEIVPPDQYIAYIEQRYFHGGFGWSPDAATRKIVTEIITKYWLAPELQRRRALMRRGERLPCWNGNRVAT